MFDILELDWVLFKQRARDQEFWCAQCLQKDIASQAKTPEDALYELQRLIVGRIVVCLELGIPPFDIPPAPQEYWDMVA